MFSWDLQTNNHITGGPIAAICWYWLFLQDYTLHKWGDLVLITGITRAITVEI